MVHAYMYMYMVMSSLFKVQYSKVVLREHIQYMYCQLCVTRAVKSFITTGLLILSKQGAQKTSGIPAALLWGVAIPSPKTQRAIPLCPSPMRKLLRLHDSLQGNAAMKCCLCSCSTSPLDLGPGKKTSFFFARAPAKTNDETLEEKEKLKYYEQVVQSLLEAERKHEQELRSLLTTYLRPLESANVLSASDFALLCGNIEELLSFQQSLLASLEETAKLEHRQKRVGACLMRAATQYKSLYSAYCANHPKAVHVLQEHGEELGKFMESKGAPSPGIMLLTVSLSNPFRRLDNFITSFQELERHILNTHPDRIEIQTCVSVYRDIKNHCLRVRKLKEAEFEIMTGTIQGWEGDAIDTYGEVIKFINAAIMVDGIKKERFLLLFPSCLLVLSATTAMSGYIFQYKIPLAGIKTSRQPDTNPNYVAFDLSGGSAEKQTIVCGSLMDREDLLDTIDELQNKDRPPTTPLTPLPPISPAMLPQSPTMATQGKNEPMSRRERNSSSTSPTRTNPSATAAFTKHKPKSISCLRPGAPVSPITVWALKEGQAKSPKNKKKVLHGSRKKAEKSKTLPMDSSSLKGMDSQALEEDSRILKVIEAYCTSVGSRNTINSVPVEPAPHVFLAEEEKIIHEETKGNETIVEEKSLIDTVYALRDQVKDLVDETKRLKRDLDDERRARKKLESTVRKSMKSGDIKLSDGSL
ncbi:rho guanine nucleotide exchange factor 7-like isoform X2 [Acanthaster planci]|uniref:Rho guanine nucleotide exchange factor 7-like isoform X2 n=1 Tax=Acanthaster planci TaxID=133434 RepID=A0A8B7YQQ7_ACAPL|nr:rho guanine nucleotide exchange factor 7-like isoform X2 [Acanthaster planci]